MPQINKMKNYQIFIMFGLFLFGCREDFLDRVPLDSPSSSTFYSNEQEIILAVNSAYRDLMDLDGCCGQSIWWVSLDATSDNVWYRCDAAHRTIPGGLIDPSSGIAANAWRRFYRGINKCNMLLDNMDKAAGNASVEVMQRVEGEARFLRAFFYGYLMELYGDVPLVTNILLKDESFVSKNAKSEVYSFVISELDKAAGLLPESYTGANVGRATKAAALGIKARFALMNKDYDAAAKAAQSVISSGKYQLHPNYEELFTYAGENNKEAILSYGFDKSVNINHGMWQNNSTRMGGGFCCLVPQRELVDIYQCKDGLFIDESPLFDPKSPYDNRDPRLRASYVADGDVWFNWPYVTNPSVTEITNVVTGAKGTNQENSRYTGSGSPASNTGYTIKKYVDPLDDADRQRSSLDFILLRYAEVLLTYAEAKIELAQIDQSVLDAINLVRERPSVAMPPINSTDQGALRRAVRYERRVELALEGLRPFDVKRYGLGPLVYNRKLLARPKAAWWANPVFPKIDKENLIPDYTGIDVSNLYDPLDSWVFRPERNYLWPIPQRERDVNMNLAQNPGY